MSINDSAGAFVPQGHFELAPRAGGPLSGLTFAVKDLFDIEGHVTGAGNPRWLETHPVADETAPTVLALLAAGAKMIGKTITDELAYSLNGDNIHYGTPKNSKAPDRVPGGSSSGSASAVAAGLCDFALGTDTGGSVRIPASYCGLLGIRTTHGAISAKGVVPLMPSFDTVGWFASDPEVFAAVGKVLLPSQTDEPSFTRLVIAEDAFAIAASELRTSLETKLKALQLSVAQAETVTVAPDGDLEKWRQVFRTASAYETWQIHGEWIDSQKPVFSAPIAARFGYGKSVQKADSDAARSTQATIKSRLAAIVRQDALLVLPTAPGPAPKLAASGVEVEDFRQRTQRLTCIAALAGLPQISIPTIEIEGAPVGLSFIGPFGSDRRLLELVRRLPKW
ncbi:MAG: amidase [Rhodomicrobium sp.]